MVTNEMKMNELEMAAGGGAMGGQYLGRMGDDEGAGTRSRTSEYVNKGACGGAALGAMVGGGIGGLVAGPAAVPFAGVVTKFQSLGADIKKIYLPDPTSIATTA